MTMSHVDNPESQLLTYHKILFVSCLLLLFVCSCLYIVMLCFQLFPTEFVSSSLVYRMSLINVFNVTLCMEFMIHHAGSYKGILYFFTEVVICCCCNQFTKPCYFLAIVGYCVYTLCFISSSTVYTMSCILYYSLIFSASKMKINFSVQKLQIVHMQ